MHLYNPDPQSGAGNCTCGLPERHRKHFHKFMAAQDYHDLCTCALGPTAFCHW